MEPVTLEPLGRQLVELRGTVRARTALLLRIDGTLQGIAAENRALPRRAATPAGTATRTSRASGWPPWRPSPDGPIARA